MELKDLVGLHELSGVDMDMDNSQVKREWGDNFEDCQVINFVIDGKTYTAIEDPEDGYRSSMSEIKLSETVVKNVFPPVEVIGIMRGDEDDVIDFFDVLTNKIVLSVGTNDYNDYYPCFEGVFYPENMAINQKKSLKNRC